MQTYEVQRMQLVVLHVCWWERFYVTRCSKLKTQSSFLFPSFLFLFSFFLFNISIAFELDIENEEKGSPRISIISLKGFRIFHDTTAWNRNGIRRESLPQKDLRYEIAKENKKRNRLEFIHDVWKFNENSSNNEILREII